jgi:hypothetical protein
MPLREASVGRISIVFGIAGPAPAFAEEAGLCHDDLALLLLAEAVAQSSFGNGAECSGKSLPERLSSATSRAAGGV